MTMITRIGLLFALLIPVAAFAQDGLDANGDGMVSLDEVQAMYPEIDSDTFMQADTDGDALLNADELAAAQDAGVIPTQEG